MKTNLSYNKLYQFRYKATTEGRIHVYDKTPLIFIIDIRPSSILAINMHWISDKKKRYELFESFKTIVSQSKNNNVIRTNLTYKLLQQPKYRPALFALRMYYHRGMTAIKDLPEATWGLVLGYRINRMRKVYKRTGYKE